MEGGSNGSNATNVGIVAAESDVITSKNRSANLSKSASVSTNVSKLSRTHVYVKIHHSHKLIEDETDE